MSVRFGVGIGALSGLVFGAATFSALTGAHPLVPAFEVFSGVFGFTVALFHITRT